MIDNSDNVKQIDILLVEDNEGDILLTKEAFKEENIINNLWVVKNGIEALAFLRQEGNYKNTRKPNIILLDLNLPKKTGFEVLKEIKTDKTLRTIPVVILTSSKDHNDIMQTYSNYANCYITKPITIEKFINVVKSFSNFWTDVAELPK